MLHNDVPIPNFMLCSEIFVPVMQHYLVGDADTKFSFSKSLSIQKSLINSTKIINSEYWTIEEFFSLADARMEKEAFYMRELNQLKDSICDEFNSLCNGVACGQFVDLVQEQAQKVINAVFDKSKIDKKMIAKKLFDDMMNGFEAEALVLHRFEKIAHTILWKQLLTPFPIKLMDNLRHLINGLKNKRSSVEIKEIGCKLVENIGEYMKIHEIKDKNFETNEKLKFSLLKLVNKRKICNVELKNINKNGYIVEEFIGKCVKNIKIKINSSQFLDIRIHINYEELYLSGIIDGKGFEQLFDRMPRKLNVLKVMLGKGDLNHYQEMGKNISKLKGLKCLDIDLKENEIRDQGIIALLNGLHQLNSIIVLNLNLWNNNIEDEGVIALSNSLKELKNISTFNLNFGNNKIGDKGIIALSNSLNQLNSIIILELNFGNNNIGKNGVTALSDNLKQLKNVLSLNLNLWNNNVGDKGAIALSNSLKQLNNIATLNLNFGWKNIGKKGVIALSDSLKQLKKISALNLDLRNTNIGDDEAIALSNDLKQLHNISTLELNLRLNNIGKQGAIALSASLKQLKNISTLNLNFANNNIGKKGSAALLNILEQLEKMSTLILNLESNKIGPKCKESFSKLKLAHPNYEISF